MGMGGLRPDHMGGMKQMPQLPPGLDREKLEQLLEMGKQAQAAKRAQHEPVLKTLEKLGIPLKTETVVGKTYVMVRLDELMEKEYAYMTGIDVAGVKEQANLGRIDLADNQNGSTGENE
jgi:hypothetical protein